MGNAQRARNQRTAPLSCQLLAHPISALHVFTLNALRPKSKVGEEGACGVVDSILVFLVAGSEHGGPGDRFTDVGSFLTRMNRRESVRREGCDGCERGSVLTLLALRGDGNT